MCLRIKHRHSDYIKIKEMMHTRYGGQFLTLSLLWKKKRKKRMKKGNKEGREEVKRLAYIWITSDTNFIPFSMYKSHSGITASWLKTPVCNLTFILDGLYKWTCLHVLAILKQEKVKWLVHWEKKVIIRGAKNRSSDLQSYDLNRRQNVHFIWLI